MKFTNLLSAATIGLAFIGCSQDSTLSSNGFEGPAAIVKGTAAKGYAVPNSPVVIIDADDDTLSVGTTDSSGQFNIKIPTEGANFPLLIEVEIDDNNQITAIVTDEDDEVSEDEEFFALVNPITDLVVRELMGEGLEGELDEIDIEEFEEMAREVVANILGDGIDWKEFFENEDFDPAIEGDELDEADLVDMILHTLNEEAEEDETRDLYELLDELEETEAKVLAQDPEFKANLIENLEEFGIMAEELELEIEELVSENEELLAELEEMEEELRRLEEIIDEEEFVEEDQENLDEDV